MRTLKLFCLVVLGLTVTAQLQHQLHGHISNMIGGDIGVDHLVNHGAQHGQYIPLNTDVAGLQAHMSHIFTVPHIGWQIGTFHRFQSMYFGSNAKVYSLTYYNQVNTAGNGYVLAQANIGFRSGNSVQVATAFGLAMISAKQQYTQVPHQVCHRKLFSKKCHTEITNVPRGFHQHEIDAIIKSTERRAALNMRNSLGLGELENSFALSNGFQDEHNKLRALYPEIEYEYFDVNEGNVSDWNHILWQALKGNGDQGARDRIYQFLAAHTRSNFLWAVNDRLLYYLIVHNNGNGTFNLHVSQFIVAPGSRLPVGAFATSVGGWSLERGGEGATPSIHQIMAVFHYK